MQPENFNRWGQLILSVITLVVAALAFVRSNDLENLRAADARNQQSIIRLEERLQLVNDQLGQLREDSAKNGTILQLLERRSR